MMIYLYVYSTFNILYCPVVKWITNWLRPLMTQVQKLPWLSPVWKLTGSFFNLDFFLKKRFPCLSCLLFVWPCISVVSDLYPRSVCHPLKILELCFHFKFLSSINHGIELFPFRYLHTRLHSNKVDSCLASLQNDEKCKLLSSFIIYITVDSRS